MIRFGTAGWSYADWDGIVYPARRPPGFDALAHMARFLDCLEVNASFYRIPSPATAAAWAVRVAERPDFRFTVKLWQGFTHGAGPGGLDGSAAPSEDEVRAREASFRGFVQPLRDAGLLGAVLAQFPYSLHATEEGRARLTEVLDRFDDLPLVVEVRHRSWLGGDLLAHLRERGAGFCNLDQPAVAANIPPTAHATSPVAYVRLHGRNAAAWFEEGAGRDRRYDYLYAAEELAGWTDRIAALAASAADVFIIANNHYRGQALANVLELKAAVEGAAVPAPSELVEAYPRLAGRAVPERAAAGRTADPAQGILPL